MNPTLYSLSSSSGHRLAALQPSGLLLGRCLLGLIFILSGSGKLMDFTATAGYMASKGLPLPELLLIPTLLIELGGGLLLVLGYQTRWAELALFLFVIPTTLIFHNFWAVAADQVSNQQIHFEKNLAIMGACFMSCSPALVAIVWKVIPKFIRTDRPGPPAPAVQPS